MARIGIITCSNCTQECHCASVVCLGDLRKRRGFFEQYPQDEALDLIGIISCAGCPTAAAPEKILKRVKAVAEFKIDALHLSFCMTAVCPFLHKYVDVIKNSFPQIQIVMGTHKPVDKDMFRQGVKELLCQTVTPPQTMNDMMGFSTLLMLRTLVKLGHARCPASRFSQKFDGVCRTIS